MRKWFHDNVGAEVAASTRIIYGGNFVFFSLIMRTLAVVRCVIGY